MQHNTRAELGEYFNLCKPYPAALGLHKLFNSSILLLMFHLHQVMQAHALFSINFFIKQLS